MFVLSGMPTNCPDAARPAGRSRFTSPTPPPSQASGPPRNAMPHRSLPEQRGLLLMLLSIVLFAANVLLLRHVALQAPEVDGFVASVYRGAVGIAAVWLVFRGRGFEPRHLLIRPLLLMRGAVGAVAILLFYVTIPKLGAGKAVLINLTYPIFGALLASRWLGERIVPTQLAWMIVALAGLGLFIAGDSEPHALGHYEWLGLAGAVVAGIAVVLIRLLSHSESTATIYGSQCLWSALAALPFCTRSMLHLSTGSILLLVLAALLVSAGQIALTEGFRTLSVATGSSLQMLLPLLTGLGGCLLFGESYRTPELIGAAITLAATWKVVHSRKPLPPPSPNKPGSKSPSEK